MLFMFVCKLILVVVLCLIVTGAAVVLQFILMSGLVVVIEVGQVQGWIEDGVVSWKGIFFVVLLVGLLRWCVLQLFVFWIGVCQVDVYGNDCMQLFFFSDVVLFGMLLVEDCLYLNVWKLVKVLVSLLVIVWIYGGGFVNGGSLLLIYFGVLLVRQGVLVVSFNYWFGCFGFFVYL